MCLIPRYYVIFAIDHHSWHTGRWGNTGDARVWRPTTGYCRALQRRAHRYGQYHLRWKVHSLLLSCGFVAGISQVIMPMIQIHSRPR